MIAQVFSQFGGHLKATRKNIIIIEHGEVYAMIFWKIS
jgi:hypothetical protein